MKPSKQQKATIQDVEREASRYIVYELGDCLWAGDPAYDERREQWTVPIHAQSLSPDVALGYVILDATGVVVRAPSRRALQRAFERVTGVVGK